MRDGTEQSLDESEWSGTVPAVTELVSVPRPDGLCAVVRLDDHARLLASFEGEAAGRDLTEWIADLLVIGFCVRSDTNAGLETPPQDPVLVAQITLEPPDASISVELLEMRERTRVCVGWAETAELLGLAVGRAITDGVWQALVEETPVSDTPPPASDSPLKS